MVVAMKNNKLNLNDFNLIDINNNNKDLIDYLKSCIDNLEYFLNDGNNLFITGNTGTGKSLLINIFKNILKNKKIMKEVKEFDHLARISFREVETFAGVILINYYNLLKDLKNMEFNKDYKNIYKQYKNVDILIIDEAGQGITSDETEASRTLLYEILDYRYNYNLNTIIASNFKKEELKLKIGQRNYSRFFNSSTREFILTGKDKR